jgi:Na+-transporting methylmalonyl-CoA/oxaloacetate decarboxylase gamma subunit
MRALLLSILAAATTIMSTALAQTPMPVVVPAMTPPTTQSPAATAVTTAATETSLKALQGIKAANDELLKQQTATLEKLDEIEKAANELRIYSKRG